MGQTIIGLSALTEIATLAYNLLKGQIFSLFLLDALLASFIT